MKKYTPVTRTCECCGHPFTAYTSATRFCSKSCNEKIYLIKKKAERSKMYDEMRLQTKVKRSQELEYKTHLTPKELAELLGVSKATVYRFISEGRIKTLQLPGKTLIRRSDVNELFNADMMNVSAYSTGKVNHTLYYTLNEVGKMYKLSRYEVLEKCQKYGIPTERHFSRIYFRKDLVDEKFEELRRPIDLSLYYTLDEAVSLFNLSNQTIYPIMREHNVKHIVYKKKTYFLKETLDKLHKEHEVLCSFKDYYSLNEVTAKFKIGKFAANSLCKAEGIEPMKCGIYLLFPKKPFEEAFARRQEKLNHLQAEKDEQQKAAEEKQIQQQKAAAKKQKKLVPEGFYSTEGFKDWNDEVMGKSSATAPTESPGEEEKQVSHYKR